MVFLAPLNGYYKASPWRSLPLRLIKSESRILYKSAVVNLMDVKVSLNVVSPVHL